MKCTNCGADLSYNEKICSNCGENNDSYMPPAPHYEQVESGDSRQNYSEEPQDPYIATESQQHNTNVNQMVKSEESWLYAILALIFGALGGWLGLLFGIIGLIRYKELNESGKRVMCGIGIGLWVFWIIILAIL